MKRVLLTALMLAGTGMLAAQDNKLVARLIPVKHLRDRELAQALNLMQVFGVNIQRSDLGVISVSGSETMVKAFEEAFQKLDVPKAVVAPAARNVEVILYVVAATSKPGASDAIPAALEPVIKQMRGVFQYPHYRALDTQIIRQRVNTPGSQKWRSETYAQVPHPTNGTTYTCITSFHAEAEEGSKIGVFRFNNFVFRCFYAATPAQTQAQVLADIDLREGQKAVVGKSSVGDDSALFLVLTARPLD